ncbi:MAG: GNAT family N-acetyltransferase [Lachnospiraceae bacterium]|nr:GNAT family N-acetyltransferase [Lachnospiraceae bacterium]
MNYIRQARCEDIERIAEILVFNYRLNFYPIFRDDSFYFEELKISKQIANYVNDLDSIWVYDDGVIKGFIQIEKEEVKKLFVEPALQGKSIGAELLEYAIAEKNVNFLWALEKNTKAIAFYKRHGFDITNEKKYEEDTTEFLVRMER